MSLKNIEKEKISKRNSRDFRITKIYLEGIQEKLFSQEKRITRRNLNHNSKF